MLTPKSQKRDNIAKRVNKFVDVYMINVTTKLIFCPTLQQDNLLTAGFQGIGTLLKLSEDGVELRHNLNKTHVLFERFIDNFQLLHQHDKIFK